MICSREPSESAPTLTSSHKWGAKRLPLDIMRTSQVLVRLSSPANSAPLSGEGYHHLLGYSSRKRGVILNSSFFLNPHFYHQRIGQIHLQKVPPAQPLITANAYQPGPYLQPLLNTFRAGAGGSGHLFKLQICSWPSAAAHRPRLSTALRMESQLLKTLSKSFSTGPLLPSPGSPLLCDTMHFPCFSGGL